LDARMPQGRGGERRESRAQWTTSSYQQIAAEALMEKDTAHRDDTQQGHQRSQPRPGTMAQGKKGCSGEEGKPFFWGRVNWPESPVSSAEGLG
jgi:hypothetical protein